MKSVLKKILSATILVSSICLLLLTSCAPAERGTVWHYGKDEPSSELAAAVGDFYMKTDTGDVYVFEETGWVNLATLNGKDGTDGTNGKDGSKWLYGNTAPTVQDGADGDFWLDTVTLKMYSKTSGAWSEIADFNK